MDGEYEKNLGLQKSLQILQERSKPSYRLASPLLKDARTPTPFLSSVKKDLFTMAAVDDSDVRLTSFNKIDSQADSSVSTDNFQIRSLNESETIRSDKTIEENKEPLIEDCMGLYNEFLTLYLHNSHSDDIFELVRQYEQACRKSIASILEFINKSDPSRKRLKKSTFLLDQLYQESYTWQLMASLFQDRFTEYDSEMEGDIQLADTTKSEKHFIYQLFKLDPSIRHSQIIVDWLEKNSQDKLKENLMTQNIRFHNDSMYWEHTLHEIHMGEKSTGIVTEMDPDAPIRQNKNLSSVDQHNEDQLMEFVFKFIRAGKLEEAQNMCRDNGHYWRAASLDGWRLWHDPNFFNDSNEEVLNVEGNPGREEWKISCWELAEQKACNIFEKAVYASLSGNLSQLLPVCNTWEDELWAHYKVMVDIKVEQEIERFDLDKNSSMELPLKYWSQQQRDNLTPRDILDSVNGRLLSEGSIQNCYRKFQSNLILNEIEELLISMQKLTVENKNPHFLRFMAHMVLFLQSMGLQTKEDVCVQVLLEYVKLLIDLKQNKLVAAYTACLPSQLQVEIYATFLQEIIDEEMKTEALNLAEESGLELKQIMKRIVEHVQLENMTADIQPEAEQRVIQAIDWLIFNPTQRIDALKQSNTIMRKFLVLKKYNPCQDVMKRIPNDSIDIILKQWRMRAGEQLLPPDYENAIHEHLCLKALLNAHDAFNSWFVHYHQKMPKKPKVASGKISFRDQVEVSVVRTEYQENFDNWKHTLDIHVKATSESIYNVLLFPGGWMTDIRLDEPSKDVDRQEEIHKLRNIHIPELTFLLHSVFCSNNQHQENFQLAEIIQSKKYKLHELFQKCELANFVSLLRQSAISLLDTENDPFGFETFNKS